MLSKSIKVILLLVMTASLSLIFVATGAFAQNPNSKHPGAAWVSAVTGVVYSQPHDLSGGLFQSSWQEPNGNDADQYVWDNFTLQSTLVITEVQWRGGFDLLKFGSGGPVQDFTVAIYASITGGSQPDVNSPPLIQYRTGGDAGQTPAGTFVGTPMYDYDFALPAPFTAAAGTTYWVQIEAWQGGVPDWGMAVGSGGDGKHFRRTTNGSDIFYLIVPGDTAFTLLGPVGATPTDTPTATPTNTPSNTPTNTPTATPTNTSTSTPTSSPTATSTATPTNTPTATPTNTSTSTPTNTPTATSTNTPTATSTATPTNTPPSNTPGKVTGGGAIGAIKGGVKGTFGFVISYLAGAPAPRGNLIYVDHGRRLLLVATFFDRLVIQGTHAKFTGAAMLIQNGLRRVRFEVEVDDRSELRAKDTFTIRLLPPNGYEAGGILTGGNITIH